MTALDTSYASGFQKETWTLYAFGILVLILRTIARVRRLGLGLLQYDDYLMITGGIWYTLLCISLNQVVAVGGSNLMDEEDIRNLTPEIKAQRVKGSKWVFVSEHAFVMTIWTLKACMIILYRRIMDGLSQQRLVKYLTIWVFLGFVGSELALFLICRPLPNYWAVPTPDYQCSSYQYYEIIQGVLAISSDILMLLIAIPLLMAVRLPQKQKLILVFIFGLGIFIIIAAILTKVYCLVPSLISYVYLNWYFREATVAMLVTCLPMTWSLLRDIFPALKSWTGGSRQYETGKGTTGRRTGSRPPFQSTKDHMQLNSFSRNQLSHGNTTESEIGFESSHGLPHGHGTKYQDDSEPLKSIHVRQDVTVTVQDERDSDETLSSSYSRHQRKGAGWDLA
ncbi:hypothetical protein TEQG_04812 [Trichophyton equinum CBS 127.97]|uniref:Rhodopsin domain-containing protein n=1 Tax=Trichophyton equinum (strain ATCC MYA-4606 / CBS 127.97) TaxID=559882 RepID=F2PV85_TRIEC|nr:hypothetical protein TEQG_04812 [Trichophyton equinum CBS 127.97]